MTFSKIYFKSWKNWQSKMYVCVLNFAILFCWQLESNLIRLTFFALKHFGICYEQFCKKFFLKYIQEQQKFTMLTISQKPNLAFNRFSSLQQSIVYLFKFSFYKNNLVSWLFYSVGLLKIGWSSFVERTAGPVFIQNPIRNFRLCTLTNLAS